MNIAAREVKLFPVEIGVWVVVIGELFVFSLFFATFLYYRSLSPELFDTSRATLRQDIGAMNTMILLASSWFVAAAVQKLGTTEKRQQALPYLVCALTCGVAFVAVKIFEYAVAATDGLNVLTDSFYMFYFMLTGIHLMHLLIGWGLLAGTMMHIKNVLARNCALNEELIGFSSSFWHMVDIVWILLFPLLYLLQ